MYSKPPSILEPLDVPQPAGDDFYRRLLDRVRLHPAVAAAAVTNGLTLSRFGAGSRQIAFRLWPAYEAPPDGFPTSAVHVEGNLFDVLGPIACRAVPTTRRRASS